MNNNLEITNIEELKKIAQGQVVEITGFSGEENDYFKVKLKRPSLLNLVGNGSIPNELLNAAHIVFFGAKTPKDIVSMKEYSNLYKVIAKAAMVEPAYEELENIGLELTDEQLIEIFNFTQRGVKSLVSFREKQRCAPDNKSK